MSTFVTNTSTIIIGCLKNFIQRNAQQNWLKLSSVNISLKIYCEEEIESVTKEKEETRNGNVVFIIFSSRVLGGWCCFL